MIALLAISVLIHVGVSNTAKEGGKVDNPSAPAIAPKPVSAPGAAASKIDTEIYTKLPYPNYPINNSTLTVANLIDAYTSKTNKTMCAPPPPAEDEEPPKEDKIPKELVIPPAEYNPKDPVVPGLDHYFDIVNPKIHLPLAYHHPMIAKETQYYQKQLALEGMGLRFTPIELMRFTVGIIAFSGRFRPLDTLDYTAVDFNMPIKDEEVKTTVRYYKLRKTPKPKPDQMKEAEEKEEKAAWDAHDMYLHRRYYLLEELRTVRLLNYMPFEDENLLTAGFMPPKPKTPADIAKEKEAKLDKIDAIMDNMQKILDGAPRSLYLPVQFFKSLVKVSKHAKSVDSDETAADRKDKDENLGLPNGFFKSLVKAFGERNLKEKPSLQLTGNLFSHIAKEYSVRTDKKSKTVRNAEDRSLSSSSSSGKSTNESKKAGNTASCVLMRNLPKGRAINDSFNDFDFTMKNATATKSNYTEYVLEPRYDIMDNIPQLIRSYIFEDEKDIVVVSIRKELNMNFKPEKDNPRKLVEQVISIMESMLRFNDMGYAMVNVNIKNLCIANDDNMKPFVCDFSGMIRANQPQRIKFVNRYTAPEIMLHIQSNFNHQLFVRPGLHTFTLAVDVYAVGMEVFKLLLGDKFILFKLAYVDGECGTRKCFEEAVPIYRWQRLEGFNVDHKLTDEKLIIKEVLAKGSAYKYVIHEVVEKMLSFDPKDRPTMNAAIEEFKKLLGMNEGSAAAKVKEKETKLNSAPAAPPTAPASGKRALAQEASSYLEFNYDV